MTAEQAKALLERVEPGHRVVLTTHVHPDGDGIGSEIALAALLRGRGAEVRIVNSDATPRALAFLDPGGTIERYEPALHDEVITSADVVVMLDNSDPQRLDRVEGAVRAARGFRACIDHHPDPDPFWDLLLVETDAACTGMVVHRMYAACGVRIDAAVAVALYTALSSDTGRFRFGNTSAEAFRMAAELVEAGASPVEAYSATSERQAEGFLRLFGTLLATMDVRCDGRLVILRVPEGLLERLDTLGEDLAEIINQALTLETSRLAVLFRQLAPQTTKVSLRSKGTLDVNGVARRHGGGGHPNASGIVIPADLEDAIARLLPDLEALARC